jgi:PAS domain S-box-containing protein
MDFGVKSYHLLNKLSSLSMSKKVNFSTDDIVSTLNNFLTLLNVKYVSLFKLDYESFEFKLHHCIEETYYDTAKDDFEFLIDEGILAQALSGSQILVYPELYDEGISDNFVIIPLVCTYGTDYLIVISLTEHWKQYKQNSVRFCELQSDFIVYALDDAFYRNEIKNLKLELDNSKHQNIAEIYNKKEDVNAILNAIQAGVIIAFKETGAILQTNPMAEKMIGSTNANLLNKPIKDFLKQENNISNKHFESKLITSNGSTIDVLRKNTVTLIFDVEYIVESFIDITDQKEAQKVLEMSKTQLEELVKIRTKDLEKTILELEDQINLRVIAENIAENEKKYSDLKTKFFLMVSHEFRTPLTMIRNNTEIIKHHHEKLTKEGLQKSTSDMLYVIDYLSLVLLNMNNYQQFGQMNLEASSSQIRFKDLIQDKLKKISQFVSKPIDIEIDVPEDHILSYSIETISPIVENLMDNVVKYAKDTISAQVVYSTDGDNHIYMISDQGIGIPSKDIARVTEIFYRGSNTLHIPGVGMGLAIVSQIIKLLGGQFDIQSIENIGTNITVKIPILKD